MQLTAAELHRVTTYLTLLTALSVYTHFSEVSINIVPLLLSKQSQFGCYVVSLGLLSASIKHTEFITGLLIYIYTYFNKFTLKSHNGPL